jgi:hypothetical protein
MTAGTFLYRYVMGGDDLSDSATDILPELHAFDPRYVEITVGIASRGG